MPLMTYCTSIFASTPGRCLFARSPKDSSLHQVVMPPELVCPPEQKPLPRSSRCIHQLDVTSPIDKRCIVCQIEGGTAAERCHKAKEMIGQETRMLKEAFPEYFDLSSTMLPALVKRSSGVNWLDRVAEFVASDPGLAPHFSHQAAAYLQLQQQPKHVAKVPPVRGPFVRGPGDFSQGEQTENCSLPHFHGPRGGGGVLCAARRLRNM